MVISFHGGRSPPKWITKIRTRTPSLSVVWDSNSQHGPSGLWLLADP